MSQKSDSSYNSSGCSTSESDEETYDVSNLCEDFKKLKPYDYEPLASSSDESDSELESDCQVPDDSRKGKKSWCKCAQCKTMQTEWESCCCQEANEIAKNLFEGMIINDCPKKLKRILYYNITEVTWNCVNNSSHNYKVLKVKAVPHIFF